MLELLIFVGTALLAGWARSKSVDIQEEIHGEGKAHKGM